MKRVFEVVNQMMEDGVIDAYALGGATAANLYVESFNTRDIDFFIHITNDGGSLDWLRPLIDYLEPMGYKADGVEFLIEGQLVQFIPFPNELTEEATRMANVVDLGGIEVRVLSPEYLVALMLLNERGKDLSRAKIFWDQEAVNVPDLKVLIKRFNLERQWQRVMQL